MLSILGQSRVFCADLPVALFGVWSKWLLLSGWALLLLD
jgi:hypothetical protein